MQDSKSRIIAFNLGNGDSNLQKGDYKLAIGYYTSALSEDKNNAKALKGRGIAYSRLQKYSDAIKDLKNATFCNSFDDDAYVELGNAYRITGKSKEAVQSYERALSLNENNARAYAYRGEVNKMLGLYDKAAADFKKATELDSLNYFAWIRRQSLQVQHHTCTFIISTCDEHIQANPNDDEAWASRGEFKMLIGQLQEALYDCNKAIELNRKNSYAYATRSTIYRKSKNYDQALKDAKEAIKLNPKNDYAYQSSGQTKHLMGKEEEAVKDFQQAVQLNPANEQAWFYMAETKLALKRYKEAIADATKGIQLNARNPYPWGILGQAEGMLEQYREVIEHMDEGLSYNPNNQRLIELKGLAQQKLQEANARPQPVATAAAPAAAPAPSAQTQKNYNSAPSPQSRTSSGAVATTAKASAPALGENTRQSFGNAKSSWQVNPNEIVMGNAISSGGMGTVYSAVWNGKGIAIKTTIYEKKLEAALQKEFDLLCTTRHSYIINILGYTIKEPHGFCLMMEYYPNGSMHQYLYFPKEWNCTTEWSLRCAQHVCEGLNFLHQKGLLHLDIKPENIFLKNDWTAVIGDFGISRSLNTMQTHQSTASAAGTISFTAPEILAPADQGATKYSKPNDVFSLGMFLWCCIAKQAPYEGWDVMRVMTFVVMYNKRLDLPATTPLKLAALIKGCWEREPSQRPTMDKVLSNMNIIYEEEVARKMRNEQIAIPRRKS